jgi:hypothetical protein
MASVTSLSRKTLWLGFAAALVPGDRALGLPATPFTEGRISRAVGLLHGVKGSGLGLAIVEHAVSAHGGRITFPAPAPEVLARVKSVLIAEDDEAMSAALRDGFKYEGYRVILAGDGEAALTLAKKTSPDLVLLDVMLPRMNGLDVCRELRGMGAGYRSSC